MHVSYSSLLEQVADKCGLSFNDCLTGYRIRTRSHISRCLYVNGTMVVFNHYYYINARKSLL